MMASVTALPVKHCNERRALDINLVTHGGYSKLNQGNHLHFSLLTNKNWKQWSNLVKKLLSILLCYAHLQHSLPTTTIARKKVLFKLKQNSDDSELRTGFFKLAHMFLHIYHAARVRPNTVFPDRERYLVRSHLYIGTDVID